MALRRLIKKKLYKARRSARKIPGRVKYGAKKTGRRVVAGAKRAYSSPSGLKARRLVRKTGLRAKVGAKRVGRSIKKRSRTYAAVGVAAGTGYYAGTRKRRKKTRRY